MSDIVISKPKLLYENVLQLKNICYRNKEETQEVLKEENFMILSAMLLKSSCKTCISRPRSKKVDRPAKHSPA